MRQINTFIVMNPSFADGERHLLKALEMQKNGGCIMGVLNAETLRKPYTKFFVQLRKSKKYEENDSNYDNTGVVVNDIVEAIVKQYEMDAGVRLIREYWGIEPSTMNSFGFDGYKSPIITTSINRYVTAVRRKLSDIGKVFDYLSGSVYGDPALPYILRQAEDRQEPKNLEFRYFTCNYYKKGICHIVFKDEDLLKKFNILGARQKGCLTAFTRAVAKVRGVAGRRKKGAA